MNLQGKKIYRAILLLSNKERKQFSIFLQSPYYVKEDHEPALTKVFLILTDKKELSKCNLLDEQAFFSLIYPEEKFILGRIDKLFSQLNGLILKFLGLQEIENSLLIPLQTAKVLREREAFDLRNRQINKIKKDISKKKGNTREEVFEILRLDFEEFSFSNLQPRSTLKESYQKILDALEKFYISNTLELSIQILAHNKFIFPVELLAKFDGLQFFLSHPSYEPSSANELLLNNVFQYLLDDLPVSEKRTRALLALTEKSKSEINLQNYLQARSIIRNAAMQLYNSGQKELESFILQLYQEDLNNGALFHEGKIQVSIVQNICTFAIRQKKFDWLDAFLKQYKSDILETELQDFIITLNRSKLLFFSGKFESVLDHLNFDVMDFKMKSAARLLEVMTYYELDSDQLSYKIEAFKVFIFRIPEGKVSKRFIIGHNTFVDILRSIIHPKTLHDTKRIAKLRQRIIDTEVIAEKNWLLEKMDQLHQLNSNPKSPD